MASSELFANNDSPALHSASHQIFMGNAMNKSVVNIEAIRGVVARHKLTSAAESESEVEPKERFLRLLPYTRKTE